MRFQSRFDAVFRLLLAFAAAAVLSITVLAQGGSALASTSRAKYFSESELAKLLMASPSPSVPTRHSTQLVPGTPYHVTLERLGAPNTATIHHRFAEMYVVRDVAGVLITGGSLLNPKPLDADTSSGTGITDGERQPVRSGDVVYIPAGTAHVYESLQPSITYLLVRLPRGEPQPK